MYGRDNFSPGAEDIDVDHQILVHGTFDGNAVLSAHFEAGKERGGKDLLLRITGTEGALELRIEPAELDPTDLVLCGARGETTALEKYTVPSRYFGPHGTELHGSSYALAQVYDAQRRGEVGHSRDGYRSGLNRKSGRGARAD